MNEGKNRDAEDGHFMTHDSVEEHLAELSTLVAEAEALGIDIWPETKPVRPWARYALASFLSLIHI